jgi:hypothetical protein
MSRITNIYYVVDYPLRVVATYCKRTTLRVSFLGGEKIVSRLGDDHARILRFFIENEY